MFSLFLLAVLGLGGYTLFQANSLLERMQKLEKQLESLDEQIRSQYMGQKTAIQSCVEAAALVRLRAQRTSRVKVPAQVDLGPANRR